jgi:hypothetical protein
MSGARGCRATASQRAAGGRLRPRSRGFAQRRSSGDLAPAGIWRPPTPARPPPQQPQAERSSSYSSGRVFTGGSRTQPGDPVAVRQRGKEVDCLAAPRCEILALLGASSAASAGRRTLLAHAGDCRGRRCACRSAGESRRPAQPSTPPTRWADTERSQARRDAARRGGSSYQRLGRLGRSRVYRQPRRRPAHADTAQ